MLVAAGYERCWKGGISIPYGDCRLFEQSGLGGAYCDMHGEGRGENAGVVVFGDRGSTCMGERHDNSFQE